MKNHKQFYCCAKDCLDYKDKLIYGTDKITEIDNVIRTRGSNMLNHPTFWPWEMTDIERRVKYRYTSNIQYELNVYAEPIISKNKFIRYNHV